MSTTVNYKGNTIATVDNETKKLTTKGTWLEDDIEITDESSGGEVFQDSEGYVVLDEGINVDEGESLSYHRPKEWMPYANGWEEENSVYFVYDLELNDATYPSMFGVRARNAYIAETGYVNKSGVFTAESTTNKDDRAIYDGFLPTWDEENDEDYEKFFVIRITPQSGKTLYNIEFAQPSNATAQTRYSNATTKADYALIQPCVEVYGNLPTLIWANLRCRILEHIYLKNCVFTSLGGSFTNCTNLVCIDGIDTWDTTNLTTFDSTFRSCSSLKYVNGLWDLDVGNVTTMSYMFVGAESIEKFDFSRWNVSNKLTDISAMFSQNGGALEIDMSNWDVSGITSCWDAFRECSSLTKLNLSGWDFSPTGLSYTFYDVGIRHLDFSIFDLSQCTNLNRFLYNCYKMVDKVDFTGKDTSKIRTMSNFCDNAHSIKEADMTGCDFSAVTDTSTAIFSSCRSLIRLKGFVYYQSFDIGGSTMMPAENLVEVLTNLPTVSSSKTITIGATNINKLTAEQIAIATEKGWTVA